MSLNHMMITNHARQRMAQRNVSERQLSFILEHGEETHRAGARLVHYGGIAVMDCATFATSRAIPVEQSAES